MLRNIEVDETATIVVQDDEDGRGLANELLRLLRNRWIQLSDMIAKKRHPGLIGLPVFRHQSRNRALGNLKPELQQFSMDARGSPDGIGGNHGSDQLADLQIHPRASWPFQLR